MKKVRKIFLASTLALVLAGCSGSGVSDDNTQYGTFIDDVVSGIKYINNDKTGYTDENGRFPYSSGSVEFFIGGIKLGEIDALPSDDKVFIQDIVGVERTNTTHNSVLKIASFLQTLDSDDTTDEIEVSRTDFDRFNDVNNSISNLADINSTLRAKGFNNIVPFSNAKRHLENVLESHGEITPSTQLALQSVNISTGATNIAINQNIIVQLNDDLPRRFLTSDFFVLKKDSDNSLISTDISLDGFDVTINPTNDLEYGESYTFTIKNTIKSFSGNSINLGGNIDKVITFTTQSDSSTQPTTLNQAPRANAGETIQHATVGVPYILDASGSSDSDGQIVSYSWDLGNIHYGSQSTYTYTPVAEVSKSFDLTVTDDDGATNTTRIVVSSTNPIQTTQNSAPTANAGADRNITVAENITLDASSSLDSDGHIVSYSWMEGSTSLSTNATFSKSDFSVGTHTLTLSVTDDDGAVSTDDVIVTVNDIAQISRNFVIEVNTSLMNTNAFANSANNEFFINATKTSGDSPLDIDCNNDGTYEATNITSSYTCSYSSPGVYEISIANIVGQPNIQFTRINPSNPSDFLSDNSKVTRIKDWGTIQWGAYLPSFSYAINLTGIDANATAPNLTHTVSLRQLFANSPLFNADLSSWNTSNITNMSGMFFANSAFNGDISSWDTSSVTDMSTIFERANSFNQNISS
ncbi:MAG TPA: BspA family leucine-rich repeat surface protein, partial [Arcobacter sp.]|nr:BspA family leucine-rich repeat surface protein [Arcobacter sp.]